MVELNDEIQDLEINTNFMEFACENCSFVEPIEKREIEEIISELKRNIMG